MPPVMRDEAGHVPSPILEREPPRQSDEVHEDRREYAQGDIDFYPPVPVEGPAPNTLPQPNLPAQPIFLQYQYNSDMAPNRTQLQNMVKKESETFKEYAQRWRDLAAQVAPPMVKREMITMMVNTLPVFYYEKLVGYMPSSFADMVFAGERIEVGLKRGKFDYVSSTSTNARRTGATGEKRNKGDTYAITSAPTSIKPPQTSHGTHQYAQHHPSFSARVGDSSNSAPVQPRAPAPIQREAPQAPAPTPTRSAGNAHFGVGSNAIRNFPTRPTPEFTLIPMTYEDLLSSPIANQMAVISPGKIYQPPFLKWYNPDATCAYHGKTPGHSTKKCLALKYKVQHLIDVGWLTFQEDRPNVKTNPLANHGGGEVNAVESGRPRRSKPLKDVTTPRRFIYEALQKGGIIPHGWHGEDSCLMHPGELHNMETCLVEEDLLQQMIDRGRLEVSDEGSEEQHICMQSADEGSFGRLKPLVVFFTRDAAPQMPRYPSVVKPVPFLYQNSHAVPWRYAPPSERNSLSAKVTNITRLSGVTHSVRVFAPPDLPTQPTNDKGNEKITEGQDDKIIPTLNENVPVNGLPEKKDGCGKKEVLLEEAGEFLRIIQQSEFKVIEQLNKTPARVSLLELLISSDPHRALLVKVLNEAHVAQDISVEDFGGLNGYKLEMGLGKSNGGRTSLISTRGNRGKFGLGYKPTQADIRKSAAGRKSGSQGSQLGRKIEGGPPCHISRSFISAGLGHEGQVIAICEDDSPNGSDLVRPCPPGFRLGNWRVEERPHIYATSVMKWLRKSFPRIGIEEAPQRKGLVPPPSLIATISRVPSTSSASRPSKDGRSTERGASSSERMSIRTFRRR
ncbi:hypothetical protein GmHk_08G023360 [Glycine max]|nr:hypothetical protein GmHk_08G023360 [Glycine max]